MRGAIALVQERLLSILANMFGGLALRLAAVGFHGILSFTVVRRTREIGIRMAIGARRTSVVWLVLRQILALGGAGLAPGIPLVFAGKRYIESELFGLQGSDPGMWRRRYWWPSRSGPGRGPRSARAVSIR